MFFVEKIYFKSPQSRNIWAHFVSISYHVGSVATKHAADFATDLAEKAAEGGYTTGNPTSGVSVLFSSPANPA